MKIRCSFCFKRTDEVTTMIESKPIRVSGLHQLNICDECVELCCNLLNWKITKSTESSEPVKLIAGLPWGKATL